MYGRKAESPQLHHVQDETNIDPIKKMDQNQKDQAQILPTPVKSASDPKEYKVIRLRNGLTVCLISDTTAFNNEDDESITDYGANECGTCKNGSQGDDDSAKKQKVHNQKMAAAALCVDVGSFSDPKSIPGLAHFAEHMFFMGSEKFPQENDLDSFFSSRGGYGNATTSVETTTFYFKCPKKDLCEGLDKLAQSLTSPLMSRSSITREREAVDSEFQQVRPSDVHRRKQLLKSLAKEDSPVNNFIWGNLKTLRDNVQLSALYEALHEFRKRHYSAHRMTLAIQAGLPIELLEAYVLDCFSDVPCNNLPPDDFSKFKEDIFDTPKWNRIYFIEPTKDNNLVEITFALPSLIDKYKTKPRSYVSRILGDEGKGSLMSYLRKKIWAQSISFQCSANPVNQNRLYWFFSIRIHLTAEGLENLFTIIETVFSFINMMKTLGPQESIYNEMKQIEDISFRFAAEQPADGNVQKIAKSMQIHPPEDYLTGPDLFYKYDPESIDMVMDLLTPRKANITVMTKSNFVFKELNQGDSIQYDKTERWYGTRYTDLTIPEEHLVRWENVQPSDELALPLPNQFITENFEIVPSISDVPTEFPVKILQSDAMELWHRKDEKLKLPVAIWYIGLQTRSPLKTAKEQMNLDLFLDLLKTQIAEDTWPARQVKLSHQFSVYSNGGVVIRVSGLNEKLPILIDLLMKHLKLFTSNLTEETFTAVKDLRMKALYNSFLDPAISAQYFSKWVLSDYFSVKYLMRYLNGCDNLKNNYLSFDEIISGITLKDMKTFAELLLKQLYVTVLVQGNVSAEQASLVAQNIARNLEYKCKFKSVSSYIINKNDNPQHQTQKISWMNKISIDSFFPKGGTTHRVKSLNKSDSTSTVINYYQSDQCNPKDRILLRMILFLIQEPLFDTLRTKEQLGYSIYCYLGKKFGCYGISITVKLQAGKHSTRHVNERIDLFMKQMWKGLNDMSESEFEEAKLHLMKILQCSANNLGEEAARNWSEIFIVKEYLFDRLQRQAKLTKELEKSDLLDWWKKHIFCGKKNKFTYRKMSTQVIGYGSQEDSTEASMTEAHSVRAAISGRAFRIWQGPVLFFSLVGLFVFCTRARGRH